MSVVNVQTQFLLETGRPIITVHHLVVTVAEMIIRGVVRGEIYFVVHQPMRILGVMPPRRAWSTVFVPLLTIIVPQGRVRTVGRVAVTGRGLVMGKRRAQTRFLVLKLQTFCQRFINPPTCDLDLPLLSTANGGTQCLGEL